MKTKHLLFALIFGALLSADSFLVTAQEAEDPHIFVIQTWIRNTGPDMNRAEADSLVKFYHENISMKNEKLLSSRTLTHYFTADSRECVFILEYKSLADMEAAFDIDDANEKKLWPDKKARAPYDKMWAKHFSHHGDAIFGEVSGTRK